MNEGNTNYEKNLLSTTSNGQPVEIKQSSNQVKIGQLEVSIASLKEKNEGDYNKLNQKVDSSLEHRKWLLTTIVAVCVAIFGVIYFITSFVNNSFNSYKELQNNYYQLLITNQKQLMDFKLCLGTNKWLNPKCFNN